MKTHRFSRREFLGSSAVLASTALLSPMGLAAEKSSPRRTAVDQVALGRTGLKLSRLGFGTGSNGGSVQRALGKEGFIRLLRYAYDQGITYIDTAENYRIHEWVREAMQGMPREKLFIQSKMPGVPQKPLEVLDRYRRELGVDQIDSLLVHAAMTPDWPDERKRVMDALAEAKEKKIIRAKGVSCHGLPALRRATQTTWVDTHLVRINPQARHIDGATGTWAEAGDREAAMKEIQAMRQQGRGVIGMKIIGNGDFTKAEDREKSIRFAMGCRDIDAIVIGFKSTAEIDEAMERMNRALAGT